MSQFVIQGGKKLKGSLQVNSAKNSALALLCAALLVKGKTVLKDVPEIEEVYRMLEVLASIGVEFKWRTKHTLEINTAKPLQLERLNKEACNKIRSSLLLFGALAARVKEYQLYNSGGCKLGLRSVRPHLFALKKLGIKIECRPDHYLVKNDHLKGGEVVMYESGDTPTENVIMAAVLAKGDTVIKFASANYMAQDLCYFLNRAGAKIEGIGSATLKITGVKKLKSVEYHVMPDPLEAMAFIALSITAHSELLIKNCPFDFLELEMEKLSVMGQKFKLLKKHKSKNNQFNIVDIKIISSELTALPDKIHGMPYPGVNIDNVPFFVPIATQAAGKTLIHDWVFENRTAYYVMFEKLGAKVSLLDPHRVLVAGKTALKATDLSAPDGIRPAMAILIGMIAAKGKSTLDNIYVIERGHERLVERLREVGVNIKKS